MRKVIRFIGILLLLVIIAVLILGLIEPKDVTVQRSLVINAPKTVVWEQITKFSNWKNWSPWYKIDTTTKMTFTGTDGQPGSNYHWESNKIGEGIMTYSGQKDNEMDYSLEFVKPAFIPILMGKDAGGAFKIEDAGNGQTKVTWIYNKHMSYPRNFMLAMGDMDKMMGKTFEDGLKNLQDYLKANGGNMVNIQEVQFPGHMYAGVRKTISNTKMDEMMQVFSEAMGLTMKNKMAPVGAAAAIYFTWDTVNHVTDMAAVIPVNDTSKKIDGIRYFNVPASKAYMVSHKGPYASLGAAHMALMKHCMDANRKPSFEIEEYIKGPHEEKDSTKYETNIYYLIQ